MGETKQEAFNFTCEATYTIDHAMRFSMKGFVLNEGLLVPSVSLKHCLENAESLINSFLQNYVFDGKYQEMKFNVDF